MKIINLSFEFEINSYISEAGTRFSLKKTRRDYIRIDARRINKNGITGTHYVSYDGLKQNLEIIEGEFFNQFFFDFPNCIKKNSYLIYKDKVLVGLCENHIQYISETRHDRISFFVKKMSFEEIRLTIEHILPRHFSSEFISIRDQMLEYMTSRRSAGFRRN